MGFEPIGTKVDGIWAELYVPDTPKVRLHTSPDGKVSLTPFPKEKSGEQDTKPVPETAADEPALETMETFSIREGECATNPDEIIPVKITNDVIDYAKMEGAMYRAGMRVRDGCETCIEYAKRLHKSGERWKAIWIAVKGEYGENQRPKTLGALKQQCYRNKH